MENRKVKQVLSRGWHQEEGEDVGKGCRREIGRNITYSSMKIRKMRTVETVPGMGRGGNKGE
jgi:hypothetical protein